MKTAPGLAFMAIMVFVFPLAAQTDQPLGPGDLVTIRALHVPEFPEQPVRVGDDGTIQLPLVGKLSVSGVTAAQLSNELRKRLSKIVREPEVSVELSERKSRPVSVLGAVKAPGLYQLDGERRLAEVLSMAGGIEPDAGYLVRVSRRKSSGPLPLPRVEDTQDYLVSEVSVEDLLEIRKPDLNIVMRPGDLVSIPRGKLVYVIGQVRKPGGFVLKEREQMSVLQALSLAEGLTPTAAGKARLLRDNGGDGNRTEVAVDVRNILTGHAPDTPMRANDILVVPNSIPKAATLRVMESAIQIGTGVVIWRR